MMMYKKYILLSCIGIALSGCSLIKNSEEKSQNKSKESPKEVVKKVIVKDSKETSRKKTLEEEARSELTLPIQVKLNNQAPKYNKQGELYFPESVPSDSIIWVGKPRGVTLIKCFPLNANGKPVGNEILIIMNNQTITSLKRAMGHKRFVKGHYIMTVEHDSKKVTFKFEVE